MYHTTLTRACTLSLQSVSNLELMKAGLHIFNCPDMKTLNSTTLICIFPVNLRQFYTAEQILGKNYDFDSL